MYALCSHKSLNLFWKVKAFTQATCRCVMAHTWQHLDHLIQFPAMSWKYLKLPPLFLILLPFFYLNSLQKQYFYTVSEPLNKASALPSFFSSFSLHFSSLLAPFLPWMYPYNRKHTMDDLCPCLPPSLSLSCTQAPSVVIYSYDRHHSHWCAAVLSPSSLIPPASLSAASYPMCLSELTRPAWDR